MKPINFLIISQGTRLPKALKISGAKVLCLANR